MVGSVPWRSTGLGRSGQGTWGEISIYWCQTFQCFEEGHWECWGKVHVTEVWHVHEEPDVWKEWRLHQGTKTVCNDSDKFQFPDHTEVFYNAHHLYVFSYYGDDQLEAFYNKWLDIVYNMKHDDRPSTNSLRDTLFRKIEHSKLMHFDISRYRTFDEGILKRHMISWSPWSKAI